MFAVIKTGGKQYRVAANDVVTVGKLEGEPGETVSFAEVLFFGKDGDIQVGAPTVAGVTVAGEVVEHTRGAKVIAFKKRRRQNSKRKRGHRQDFTVVRITDILTGGAKPAAKAKSEPKAAAPKAEASAPKADKAEDIELIAGIGATLKKKLVAAGVTSWKQIADWTDADVAKYDEELNLRGRITREEWVEQAKELLAGKPPRAKIDQEKAQKGE